MSNHQITKSISLLPKQKELLESTEREVLMSGGWRSSKTFALCYSVLKEACRPNNVILLCRKTYKSLRSSTLNDFLYGTDPILPKGSYKYNKVEQKITLNGINSVIYLSGLDDMQKIRSMTLGMVAVDEASQLEENDWIELFGRLSLPAGSRRIIAATNPSVPSHFLFKRFFVDKNKNRRVITSTPLDNPFLPVDYLNSLKDLPEQMYNRFVLGQWIALENAVYKEFNRKIHVKQRELGEFHSYMLGVDFGFTNPCAIALIGIDGDDNIHVLEEVKESKMLIGQIVNRCEKYKDFSPKVIVDPSAPALIAELEQAGFDAIKANNDVDSGIARVQNYLRNNKLTIDIRCEETIKELENYQRDDKGKVVKIEDHLCDGIRYALQYLLDNKQSRSPLLVLGAHDQEFA